MDNLDWLYILGMIGWVLFIVSIFIIKVIRKQALYNEMMIKEWEKHCEKLAMSHGETLQPLFEVLEGKKKSFLFNGVRFRLCYTGKKRNSKGEFITETTKKD